MSNADDDVDPYELLGIKTEATEQEIKTAYRQRSLKVHPDRNPNNPDAARKFHELNQAYELLLDPLRRLALDAKLRIKLARKERFKAYDTKRKNLVEELEERERQFKKARVEKQEEELKVWRETERIKEEGRRMREERERNMRVRQEEEKRQEADKEEEAPSLGDFDTTVRLKYLLASHPTLTTPSSLVSLLSPFGEVDESSIVLSIKPPKKTPNKPPKYGTALVPFKKIGDAFAVVCASGQKRRGLEGVEVGWVEGKEPPILGWLRKMGKLGSGSGGGGMGTSQSPSSMAAPIQMDDKPGSGNIKAQLPQHQMRSPSSSSTFASSFPDIVPVTKVDISSPKPSMSSVAGLNYEEMTLMRLRQAERERLEKEIREQEAVEGG